MPDKPFRLRVLEALTDSLKQITVANGYKLNLSDVQKTVNGITITESKVFRGRTVFGVEEPLPAVSILEHPAALDALLSPTGDQSGEGWWNLLIQGFAKDDKAHPTDNAHILAADILKRLAYEGQRKTSGTMNAPDILGFGFQEPCITEMRLGRPVVRPADEVISDTPCVWLVVGLKMVEDPLDPYQ